jgi:hypothetical protein
VENVHCTTGAFTATARLEIAPEPEPEPVYVPSEPLLITIGSFVVSAVYVITTLLAVITLLVIGAFNLGRQYGKTHGKPHGKSHDKPAPRATSVKTSSTKLLLALRKRHEKNLKILQNTRHSRVLSKEEKEIKEAIEEDLDEIDRVIEEQKTK